MPFNPKELVYCETCKVSITKAHIAAHRSVSHRQKSERTWTEQGLPFFCPECDKFVNKKRGHLKTASHANKARAYWESETCKLCKVSFPIRERGEHLKSESHIFTGMILEKRKSEQRQLQLTRGEILSKIYGVREVDLEEHKSVSRARFYANLQKYS